MNNQDTISRAALLEELDTRAIDVIREFDAGYKAGVAASRVIVGCAPTIEPQVVHGRWETVKAGSFMQHKCSICGFHAGVGRKYNEFLHCPSCGAKMDGGGDDATD